MFCPKCEGTLISEDGVIFCGECLYVLIRRDDIAIRKVGRPFGAQQSGSIKGIPSISKSGNIYYKYKSKTKHHKITLKEKRR